MEQPQEAPQFSIDLPEEIRKGQYSNLVLVAHSQSEFVLDFISLLPGPQQASVHSRQVLTPDNIKRLSIKTPSMKEHIGNLSGGNQQKVILARWLCQNKKIVIFDEPTAFLDPQNKYIFE